MDDMRGAFEKFKPELDYIFHEPTREQACFEAGFKAGLASQDWQPIETAPKDGEFLVGVWIEWQVFGNTERAFKVYEATGYPCGQVVAINALDYKIVCWKPKPEPPTEEGLK